MKAGPFAASRRADGARGDDPPHAGAAGDGPEVPQGLVGALEAVGRDAPGAVQLPHEPQRGPAAGQDVQVAAGLLPVHHHAAGVRADVDDGRRGSIVARAADALGPGTARQRTRERRPREPSMRTEMSSRRQRGCTGSPRARKRELKDRCETVRPHPQDITS